MKFFRRAPDTPSSTVPFEIEFHDFSLNVPLEPQFMECSYAVSIARRGKTKNPSGETGFPKRYCSAWHCPALRLGETDSEGRLIAYKSGGVGLLQGPASASTARGKPPMLTEAWNMDVEDTTHSNDHEGPVSSEESGAVEHDDDGDDDDGGCRNKVREISHNSRRQYFPRPAGPAPRPPIDNGLEARRLSSSSSSTAIGPPSFAVLSSQPTSTTAAHTHRSRDPRPNQKSSHAPQVTSAAYAERYTANWEPSRNAMRFPIDMKPQLISSEPSSTPPSSDSTAMSSSSSSLVVRVPNRYRSKCTHPIEVLIYVSPKRPTAGIERSASSTRTWSACGAVDVALGTNAAAEGDRLDRGNVLRRRFEAHDHHRAPSSSSSSLLMQQVIERMLDPCTQGFWCTEVALGGVVVTEATQHSVTLRVMDALVLTHVLSDAELSQLLTATEKGASLTAIKKDKLGRAVLSGVLLSFSMTIREVRGPELFIAKSLRETNGRILSQESHSDTAEECLALLPYSFPSVDHVKEWNGEAASLSPSPVVPWICVQPFPFLFVWDRFALRVRDAQFGEALLGKEHFVDLPFALESATEGATKSVWKIKSVQVIAETLATPVIHRNGRGISGDSEHVTKDPGGKNQWNWVSVSTTTLIAQEELTELHRLLELESQLQMLRCAVAAAAVAPSTNLQAITAEGSSYRDPVTGSVEQREVLAGGSLVEAVSSAIVLESYVKRKVELQRRAVGGGAVRGRGGGPGAAVGEGDEIRAGTRKQRYHQCNDAVLLVEEVVDRAPPLLSSMGPTRIVLADCFSFFHRNAPPATVKLNSARRGVTRRAHPQDVGFGATGDGSIMALRYVVEDGTFSSRLLVSSTSSSAPSSVGCAPSAASPLTVAALLHHEAQQRRSSSSSTAGGGGGGSQASSSQLLSSFSVLPQPQAPSSTVRLSLQFVMEQCLEADPPTAQQKTLLSEEDCATTLESIAARKVLQRLQPQLTEQLHKALLRDGRHDRGLSSSSSPSLKAECSAVPPSRVVGVTVECQVIDVALCLAALDVYPSRGVTLRSRVDSLGGELWFRCRRMPTFVQQDAGERD